MSAENPPHDGVSPATFARNLERFHVRPQRAALLIVDFQEKLTAAMPDGERAACERNIPMLIEIARRQQWPVIVSLQYPEGLGDVTKSLASALAAPDLSLHRFDKLHFACTDAPPFKAIFDRVVRDQWIVVGLETHVCVLQTARGLLERGVDVHVPVDAVASRRNANRDQAIHLMETMGAVMTTTESVLFDALHTAGSPDFKPISRLVRRSHPTCRRFSVRQQNRP